MNRIHVIIQIQNNILIRLKIVNLHIVIRNQRFHRRLSGIEIFLRLPAPVHAVPPKLGIGRQEKIKFCLRMLFYHICQQTNIFIYPRLPLRQLLHRCNRFRPLVMLSGLFFRKGFVLPEIIRHPIVVPAEIHRQQIRDILKQYILVEQILHVIERIFII